VLESHPINKARRKAGHPIANTVLTRGAGHAHQLNPLEVAGTALRVACVSGDRTIAGIATLLGADIVSEPGMTASLDTDLVGKFDAATRELKDHDLVVLHVKGADIAAHDCRPDLKVGFLERVDEQLGRMLEGYSDPLRVAVVSDHATLSEVGLHTADPVPILIWGVRIDADETKTFDEPAAIAGSLRRLPMQTLLGRLFDLSRS
jgi:2,3-bisphosphoglycerate-independent phosphoglycerate mutase